MLMYFQRGWRRFEKHPDDVAQRHNWEFFAVVAGRVGRYYGPEKKDKAVGSALWLSRPGCRYSWHGGTIKAERIVFHFASVDESLKALMEDRDFLEMPLDKKEIAKLVAIARRTEPHYQELGPLSSLYFTQAQVELSLLVASKIPLRSEQAALTTKHQVLARRAVAFFRGRLPVRHAVDQVAREMSVSAVHLRRIFLEVFGETPKHVFLRTQLEHAKEMAGSSDLLIEEIARRSGFSGAPDFCRAFRNFHATTFHGWRMQLCDLKRLPHLRRTILDAKNRLGPAPSR